MDKITTQSTLDNEIDMLELLAVLAEYWKLLLLVPAVAAAIAFGVATLWPKSYESSAVISAYVERTTAQATPYRQGWNVNELAVLIESQALLNAVAQKLDLLADANTMQQLRDRIRVIKDRSNAFITVTARAPTSEQAQNLTRVVLGELFLLSRPSGAALQRLQSELEGAQASLQAASRLERSLAVKMSVSDGRVNESIVKAYADLMQVTDGKRATIKALQTQLDGVSPADVLVPPDLPQKPVSPKRMMAVILTGMAVLVLLLLGVLMRHAWRLALRRPGNAENIRRIRAAFCW